MGHYDNCRDGNCGVCGQLKGRCEHTKKDRQELNARPITEPGPIYYRSLEDQRKLRWSRWSEGFPAMVMLDRIYIGARYNEEQRVWMLGRVRWCEHHNCWETVQDFTFHQCNHEEAHITHFTDDILGTP